MVLIKTSDPVSQIAAYQAWLRSHQLASSTVEQYLQRIRHFVDWWGNDTNTHTVTREDLENYQEETFTPRRAAPRTLFRVFCMLRSWFDYLKSQGLIMENPASGMPLKLEHKNSVNSRITDTEVKALLSAIDTTTFRGSRDDVLVRILFDTGIDVSKLLSIRPADINYAAGTIVVKMRKDLAVCKIAAETLIAIDRHLSKYPTKQHSMLFTTRPVGQKITRQGAWKAVRAYAKRAGIESPVTPRSFKDSLPVQESLRQRIDRLRKTVELLPR